MAGTTLFNALSRVTGYPFASLSLEIDPAVLAHLYSEVEMGASASSSCG